MGIKKDWEEKYRKYDNIYVLEDKSKKNLLSIADSIFIKKIIESTGVGKDSLVLEAGCASGKLACGFAIRGCRSVGLDFLDEAVSEAKAVAREAFICFGDIKFDLVQGDIFDICFKKDIFDLIFSEGVIEHFIEQEERQKALRRMVEVTKKGGYVATIVPNGKHPFFYWWMLTRYEGHIKNPKMIRYDIQSLRRDMEYAGLEIVMTDGIDLYRSLWEWPRLKVLIYIASQLNKVFPQEEISEKIRTRWGRDLICVGRKL